MGEDVGTRRPLKRALGLGVEEVGGAVRPGVGCTTLPVQLQRRSIVAAPGRASPRLGAVRCNRLLCQPGTTIAREPVRGAWMADPDGPSEGWRPRAS